MLFETNNALVLTKEQFEGWLASALRDGQAGAES